MTNFTTSTPHDALFKTFLTHPDTARDFMEIHLPKDLRELCDLDSLKLESASFVDEKLRALHSDILWSVKTREGDGYIYVVIEHQSREDIHMAFRLMRYSMAVMQRHIEHDKRQPLPLVIPMLFYHGSRSPYPWSLCWLDEFADPTTARKLYTLNNSSRSTCNLKYDEYIPLRSRWWMSLSCRMTRLCSIAESPCWS